MPTDGNIETGEGKPQIPPIPSAKDTKALREWMETYIKRAPEGDASQQDPEGNPLDEKAQIKNFINTTIEMTELQMQRRILPIEKIDAALAASLSDMLEPRRELSIEESLQQELDKLRVMKNPNEHSLALFQKWLKNNLKSTPLGVSFQTDSNDPEQQKLDKLANPEELTPKQKIDKYADSIIGIIRDNMQQPNYSLDRYEGSLRDIILPFTSERIGPSLSQPSSK